MKYTIATLDGFTFQVEATEDSCIDSIHGNDADIGWNNEAELLAWVAENIENIARFERSGADLVIGI